MYYENLVSGNVNKSEGKHVKNSSMGPELIWQKMLEVKSCLSQKIPVCKTHD